MMLTPQEVQSRIAHNVKTKRLEMNLSQHTLSARSGVSYSVVKKFESTSKISLESLLKLALALDAISGFNQLFAPTKPENAASLDDLLQESKRKRGRQ